jgi:hypothetical protein
LLDSIYHYVDDLELFLKDIMGVDYKIVFIASYEWNLERKKYIKNIKSGKKYEYIDESIEKNVNSNYTIETKKYNLTLHLK